MLQYLHTLVMCLKLFKLSRPRAQPRLKILQVLHCITELRCQLLCLGVQLLASALIMLQVSKSVLDLSIQLLVLHQEMY